MTYPFCSDDFSVTPWWWSVTPPTPSAETRLPASTDVLVVGSGYTGLHCALETAAAGRETTLIDAQDLGWGCSTRNGGQISGEIKPGFAELSRRYSESEARALIGEARGALEWLGEFVEREKIDCDYRRCGRFIGAHSRRQFDRLLAGPGKVPRRPAAPGRGPRSSAGGPLRGNGYRTGRAGLSGHHQPRGNPGT